MRALITRPRENAAAIARALAERDIEVLLEPLLEIGPTEHDPIDLTGIQAVLVTSAFGAKELAHAVAERGIPLYAVGDATADAAREAGFTTVESARGDADALEALVRERLAPDRGPLLYAAGRTTAGDLPEKLTEAGFDVRRVELYAARPAAGLSLEAVAALRDGSLDLALFFSPRTATTFVRLVQEAELAAGCAGVTAFCLSPAVAEALQPLPFRQTEIAAQPNHDAVVASVQEWIERQRAPEPEAPSAAVAPAPAPERSPPPRPLPVAAPQGQPVAAKLMTILLILVLCLAAGGFFLWRDQARLKDQLAAQQQQPIGGPALTRLEQQVGTLQSRLGDDISGFERRVTARVAETERQVGALKQQIESVGAPADGAATAALAELEPLQQHTQELASRLSSVEQRLQEAVQGLRQEGSAVAPRFSMIDEAQKAFADRVAALERKIEQAGTMQADRLQRLEAGVQGLDERLAAAAQAARRASDENSTLLLLAAGQVRTAIETGKPFASPMANLARAAERDPRVASALGQWTERASEGIPTVEELRRRFTDIASSVEAPIVPDTGHGWLDRALERATAVVRVRRVGEEVSGGGASAVLARAEAALNQDDLARTVVELDALPADAKAPFADWMALARARLQAREALATIERTALDRAGGG